VLKVCEASVAPHWTTRFYFVLCSYGRLCFMTRRRAFIGIIFPVDACAAFTAAHSWWIKSIPLLQFIYFTRYLILYRFLQVRHLVKNRCLALY
jgi:hypothetical protein